MKPSDSLRLLTFDYNTPMGPAGSVGSPIVERRATILTDKQPWEYLLDPDIESPKSVYITMLYNVVEIPPNSLTQDDINELLGRG